ncbi:uncharacterized protein FA14DRAFT_174116 [Meira miltonrushii]|uniref:Uncharacterized protein n=1 Tax=Meira miltonrushii TaxID=1280837 RepID=A0A316VAE8_9BASI|nr:uncharacterized protein FA14DRAFT_174116 [Meira miltonrushii]PWN34452.1 hypothetical protein FA14DRAFT_174116 [Meira miltonrushii]
MFSPQRRQILGAKGRLSPKKPGLGTEEAANVGPKQLFNDLKQTSSKKASTSASIFGGTNKSRAFGEKTNRSPQRSNEEHDAGSVPVKPRTTHSPTKGKLKSSIQRSGFVTPSANIGHAGALRMQMGEFLDARAGNGIQSVEKSDSSVTVDGRVMTEEELYPEIEYMPPPVEVPYDFPAELDGLPRGAEMGDMLQSIVAEGFYKPQRPESIEMQRREDLENVPDPSIDDFVEKTWPQVEQRGVKPLETSKRTASSSHGTGKAPSVRPITQAIRKPFTSSRETKSNTQTTGRRAPVVTEKKAVSVQKKPFSTASTTPRTNLASKSTGSSAVPSKVKALSLKDNNTQVRRGNGPTKSKLDDFENDKLAKSIQAKFLRAEQENGFEGFEL